MSTPQLSIDVNSYSQIVDLGQGQLRAVARTIFRQMSSGGLTPFRRLIIDPIILEYLNIRYAEKQVKGIDENFLYYDLGVRLRHLVPGTPLPIGRSYLTEKAFSGDVSGDIGESVFAYFLILELGVDGMRISHLRPEKIRGHLTPDFVILEQNAKLTSFFGCQYSLPIYAEVKSSTNIVDIKRIKNGLLQLKTIMPVGSHTK
jgi:hypothetical protein